VMDRWDGKQLASCPVVETRRRRNDTSSLSMLVSHAYLSACRNMWSQKTRKVRCEAFQRCQQVLRQVDKATKSQV